MIIPVAALQISAGILIASGTMCILWLVQRRIHNAGIVDAGWAFCIGLLSVMYSVTSGGYVPRRILIAILVGAWAGRLSVYLMKDRVLGRPEDGRYASLRKKWGGRAEAQLFAFFQYQALFAVFFSLPALVISHHALARWTALDTLGASLWVFSVGNTILADRHLAQFRAKATNHGKTCRKGWWRYSRHPNYFFEWMHWGSYVVIAIGSPCWWLTLPVPVVLLYLLLKVTGIPPTEAQALASRGNDYRDYQRTTSKFIPWFPKKERGKR